MTAVRFTKAAVSIEGDGTWLKLRLLPEDTQKARKVAFGIKERIYTAELKEHREKRSMDANGYFWTLLDKLADAVGDTKEALYLDYVQKVGPFRDFTLTQDEAKTFRTAWSMLGTGWPTEQVDYAKDGERVVVRAYYGSSTYNTKQMSRLIDSVVEDCKQMGIETMTPEKLALLKENWR